MTSLSGLENLTYIAGGLDLVGNPSLTSLTGLEGLTHLAGDVHIGAYSAGNPSLESLSGLDNLVSIGGSLLIGYNISLTNLTGLNNLSYITGNLDIGQVEPYYHQCGLTNLIGLNNLDSIGGSLLIWENGALESLSGLENLTMVKGDVQIGRMYSWWGSYWNGGNPKLFNINGLSNLGFIGGNLEIVGNDSLTSLTSLEDLTCVKGSLFIGKSFNWYGEIRCGNPSLTSLSGLENLVSIDGGFSIISNNALTSLSGLDNLVSIGGGFSIEANNALTSFSGLENLVSIGGGFSIKANNTITSLTGLENLSLIGGDLMIGDSYWVGSTLGNASLVSLAALENLNSIGGTIVIGFNDLLPSLSGLNNIAPGSISNLEITSNASLYECEVQSICDYLVSPNGLISIHDNASGCNSQEEVEEACGITGTEEFQIPGSRFHVEVYPNPASDQVVVSVTGLQSAVGGHVTLKIYDLYGKEIRTLLDEVKSPGEYTVKMDVSHLPAGVYLVRVQAGGESAVRKLVVQ